MNNILHWTNEPVEVAVSAKRKQEETNQNIYIEKLHAWA